MCQTRFKGRKRDLHLEEPSYTTMFKSLRQQKRLAVNRQKRYRMQ